MTDGDAMNWIRLPRGDIAAAIPSCSVRATSSASCASASI